MGGLSDTRRNKKLWLCGKYSTHASARRGTVRDDEDEEVRVETRADVVVLDPVNFEGGMFRVSEQELPL